MSQFDCQKCARPILEFYAQPGQIVRCVHCGARHAVPDDESADGNWITESKKLQQLDDSMFQRWMPWIYRIWAITMSLFYVQIRLDSAVFATIFPVALILGAIATFGCGYYVQVRCYGWPFSVGGQIMNIRGRWLIESLIIVAMIILFIETAIRIL